MVAGGGRRRWASYAFAVVTTAILVIVSTWAIRTVEAGITQSRSAASALAHAEARTVATWAKYRELGMPVVVTAVTVLAGAGPLAAPLPAAGAPAAASPRPQTSAGNTQISATSTDTSASRLPAASDVHAAGAVANAASTPKVQTARLAGPTRYDTAAAVALYRYVYRKGMHNEVRLVRGDRPLDAVATATSLPMPHSPMLYVPASGPNPSGVRAAYEKLGALYTKVLGSRTTMPPSRLSGLLGTYPEWWGMDPTSLSLMVKHRFIGEDTAVKVIENMDVVPMRPLSQAAAATTLGRPMLLMPPSSRLAWDTGWLALFRGERRFVGGASLTPGQRRVARSELDAIMTKDDKAKATSVELYGRDRFDTAATIAQLAYPHGASRVCLVNEAAEADLGAATGLDDGPWLAKGHGVPCLVLTSGAVACRDMWTYGRAPTWVTLGVKSPKSVTVSGVLVAVVDSAGRPSVWRVVEGAATRAAIPNLPDIHCPVPPIAGQSGASAMSCCAPLLPDPILLRLPRRRGGFAGGPAEARAGVTARAEPHSGRDSRQSPTGRWEGTGTTNGGGDMEVDVNIAPRGRVACVGVVALMGMSVVGVVGGPAGAAPSTTSARAQTVRVDVDGDARLDTVVVGPMTSRVLPVSVRTAKGAASSVRIGRGEYFIDALPVANPFHGAAEIDGAPGKELVVHIGFGAHTDWAKVVTWRKGRLTLLQEPRRRTSDWTPDGSATSSYGYTVTGRGTHRRLTVTETECRASVNSCRARAFSFAFRSGRWKLMSTTNRSGAGPSGWVVPGLKSRSYL